jgi:hypothetical protein
MSETATWEDEGILSMATKINEHGSTPQQLKQPVYRHASETVRSPNDAGGKVERSDYSQGPLPQRQGGTAPDQPKKD